MSSQGDEFFSAQNEDLQFDTNAFSIFSACILFVVLLYKTIQIVFAYRKDFKASKKNNKKCSCQDCLQTEQKFSIKKDDKNKHFQRLFPIAILLLILIYAFKTLKKDQSLKGFDPFDILKVSSEASDKEISKAFKSQAKIHHPDKNHNDPNAHKNFILISKAYACIKNAKARENCLYNNKEQDSENDFEQQVGIAFPSFVLAKENQYLILSLFFIFLIFVFPYMLYWFYQSWDLTDEHGSHKLIEYLTLELAHNENLSFSQFLLFLCKQKEIMDILMVNKNQLQSLIELKQKDYFPFKLKEVQIYQKPYIILYALFKEGNVHESLKEDLIYIQEHLLHIIDSLMENIINLYILSNQQEKSQIKKIHFTFIQRLLGFCQQFYQGALSSHDQLIQLPLVNYNNLEDVQKAAKTKQLPIVLKTPEIIQKIQKEIKQEYFIGLIENFQKVIPNLQASIEILNEEDKPINEPIYEG